MSTPPSVRQVIEALGGVPWVARQTGLTQPAIWHWVKVNRVPNRWTAALRDIAASRGVSVIFT